MERAGQADQRVVVEPHLVGEHLDVGQCQHDKQIVIMTACLSTVEVQACAAMSGGVAIRQEDEGAVRRLVLCRPEAYNTITPALRDELGAALDAADRDHDVRVVLLSAEGPAFCAGFARLVDGPAGTQRGRRASGTRSPTSR